MARPAPLEFKIDGLTYGLLVNQDWGASARRLQTAKARLRGVLKPLQTTIDEVYDFGDHWEHRITVTTIRPGQQRLSYPH